MSIVLAYSGGLDTSVAVHWLKERYQTEVIAYCANLGQIEDLEAVSKRATAAGASEVIVEDVRDLFLHDYAIPALAAGAAYEGKYLLAAPLSRPLIAERLVSIARERGASAVAHGATGKGNDQVRFYTSVRALAPELDILAPVIDWEMTSRGSEIAYADRHGIDVGVSKTTPYSIDTNIWGTSIECGDLDLIDHAPPPDAWQITTAPVQAPDRPTTITIEFEAGIPVALDGRKLDLIDLVSELGDTAAANGIGRTEILESRIVGFKSRGIYEAPAATVLLAARTDLEALVLDRETLHHKRSIADQYAELVYYGYWFTDLRAALDAYCARLAHRVTGTVTVELYKGSARCIGRTSPKYGRYSSALADYEEADTFLHEAGAGFAYCWALPLTEGVVTR
ncbi:MULTISPECIES: argininosuccinate synthase [Nocardiaceae]|uniref:Argininosuccinate synthase n=2 Tax=Rhodococcoides fascians TaxID=1828 RepID=ASSY_RHOFA|nr:MULTISPECIES: argininosuccinate synthase [Rhodococcus]Q93JQ8.1 RecName: Full=Argininosuccinate synthase; AltName: Full=Citrulline--aspartate ligase [Rhodococcus fascians]AET25203.1 putative argininosuccinate synthase [Rhodococcus fascians D188]AMY56230.1 Argininosuccinate synthase [Rhodococcus fascians D188]OZC43741.1 argininosuccinate synthase [Rhodococcus sp. RS1C4]OZC51354.1 argininosuccinate synthase [Rhodococcus sp. 06-621-2]OZC60773.1 argininosuccinate synthase [Rhodococcus sp. 06-46